MLPKELVMESQLVHLIWYCMEYVTCKCYFTIWASQVQIQVCNWMMMCIWKHILVLWFSFQSSHLLVLAHMKLRNYMVCKVHNAYFWCQTKLGEKRLFLVVWSHAMSRWHFPLLFFVLSLVMSSHIIILQNRYFQYKLNAKDFHL